MTSDLTTLDLSTLDLVIGGAGPGEEVEGNVGVTANKNRVQAGVQFKYSGSDYVKCVGPVAHMPGATPADIRNTCGLPPK